MDRRRFLATVGLAASGGLGAGCLSTGRGTTDADGTPTDSPTESATPTPSTETPSPPTSPSLVGTTAGREPNPDHEVRLANDDDASHAVAVTVTDGDGAVVYEATHDLDPGEEVLAYNLERADPDGVEAFEVTAETGDRRESVTIETSGCYGDVVGTVRDDGTLDLIYSVC